jgi:hypothetical protein
MNAMQPNKEWDSQAMFLNEVFNLNIRTNLCSVHSSKEHGRDWVRLVTIAQVVSKLELS